MSKKKSKENCGEVRYQRYSVHRYPAGVAGDFHDNHPLDSQGARCCDSPATTAGNSAATAG